MSPRTSLLDERIQMWRYSPFFVVDDRRRELDEEGAYDDAGKVADARDIP
jgi:hypothetical protein